MTEEQATARTVDCAEHVEGDLLLPVAHRKRPRFALKLTDEQLTKLADGFRLSPREAEILALLFEGIGSSQELARRLGVSVPTVKLDLRMLYAKVGRATKHELVIKCLEMLNPRFG